MVTNARCSTVEDVTRVPLRSTRATTYNERASMTLEIAGAGRPARWDPDKPGDDEVSGCGATDPAFQSRARRRDYFATFTYLPLTTLRIALAPAPSRTSLKVISPATPGKFFIPLRHSRILSRSESRSAGALVTPAFSMQDL